MLTKIDLGTIQNSIRDSTPITFRITSFTHDQHATMDRVIEVFLTELGQERFLEPLAYCVKELIGNVEKSILIRTLSQFNGSQKSAAKFLGIKYTTLNEKLKRYNIRFDKKPV